MLSVTAPFLIRKHVPEFKLYLIKDYQRLKKNEAERKSIGWDEKRALSQLNYYIYTDAIERGFINRI